MGTIVSKRRNSEALESTAVKIRVVAAFQGNRKDNSRDKEGEAVGQQSSNSVTESTAKAAAADIKTTSLQIRPSVANTKFPKGVYPQRESNLSIAVTGKEDSEHDHMQPYRLKLGVITSSGAKLDPYLSYASSGSHDHHDDKLEESSAVIQLHPIASGNNAEDHSSSKEIPDGFDWLLKKGVSGAEMHSAASVIQKNVRGYQCRRKLIKEAKSAALIQRSFRQWRKNSSMLLQRRSDEQMFIPANSIATNVTAVDNEPETKPLHFIDEYSVGNAIDNDIITDNEVSSVDNKQQTNSSALLTATSQPDGNNSSNTDIVSALKEVCNMLAPDFTDIQLPNEGKAIDVKLLGEKTREHLNSLYRSSILNSARNKALNIGKEQFKMYLEFQNQIDETMFLAQQKAELCLGESYVPRKVLLISSRVPKVALLQCAVLPDVITFVYDFERATYFELINKIANALDEYKKGAKIKNLGIICKGGPGHLYLFANKPVTPVKLFKNHKMMTFWRVLGAMMSKLVPEETTIHFMESNVDGNKQGEQLLRDIERLMYPSKVNIKCPLEISASGQMMISTYFHPPKYRLWKQNRYTKLKLY